MARKRNRQRRNRKRDMVDNIRGLGGAAPDDMIPGRMPGNAMPEGGGMASGMPTEQQVPEGEEELEPNVTPEEQAIYHKFMENYYTIMYVGGSGQNGGTKNPPAADKVREEYFSGETKPVDALANAGVAIIKFLADSAYAAEKPIPYDILMHAGVNEVLPDLAELAESEKFHEYTDGEMEGALFLAMDLYRDLERSAGRLNQDEAKADFDTLVSAEQQGKLDEVLPGATRVAEEFSANLVPQQKDSSQEGAQTPQLTPQGIGTA